MPAANMESPAKDTSTKEKSAVKHFFEFPDIKIETKTKFKAKCTECKREVAGYGKTTSDFVKHMEVGNHSLNT